MKNVNDRPVCHRAEDLVTYLYGEATAEEAGDFANHLQQCDSCRVEFRLFNQVHESIVAWRNEAFGSVVLRESEAAASYERVPVTNGFVLSERKLSALTALREFFSVSPLWLRGATAFAGLLLCALIVFTVSRAWRQPAPVANNQPNFSQEQFEQAVQKEVESRMAKLTKTERQDEAGASVTTSDKDNKPGIAVATQRARPKLKPVRLTREESEQLAADLGLIPGREEEFPFVLPDEPNY